MIDFEEVIKINRDRYDEDREERREREHLFLLIEITPWVLSILAFIMSLIRLIR